MQDRPPVLRLGARSYSWRYWSRRVKALALERILCTAQPVALGSTHSSSVADPRVESSDATTTL